MNAIVFGHNGVNATGLVRSLGRKGHHVYVILHSDLVNFTATSKYVKRVWFVESESEWLETIKSACKEIGGLIAFFSAGDDEAKFINLHQEELEGLCVVEGVLDKEIKHLYFQKNYIYKLAKEAGLQLINTYVLNNSQEPLPNTIDYPVMVKALDSTMGGKEVMNVCGTRDELTAHINDVEVDFFPIQLQPFIKKEKEIMLQGCSLRHGQQVLIPVCFIKTRFCGCGDGYGSYGYSTDSSKDKNLLSISQKISNIISKIGYQGLFSAEFLYAHGQYLFLEINFRNDGTSIVSTESGFNLPDIYCKSVESSFSYEIGDNTFHKIYYMCEDDFKHVFHGDISMLEWIKDALRRNCYWYMTDRDDWKPLLSYVYFRIKRKVYNIIKR